ncbi:monooxygenase family protein [Aldersonia kunmingensis]|uniref:monooxygenase family protein n=1 Tax=Aldersonia kunmingensis TaxID=408066 RepID=UPI000836C7D5|nr:DUF4188 domain-containing protein [Aldersonia kunmingensis]
MAKINQGRWTADYDGDVVVFIIGTRLPSPWHLVTWFRDLGGLRGMQHMLKYLSEHPEKGLLGYNLLGLTNVQYWRSFEDLEAFARDTENPHAAVWRNYWKRVGKSTRSGIWHETYRVRAGEYETIYGNMPAHGLAKATGARPIAAGMGARSRMRRKVS